MGIFRGDENDLGTSLRDFSRDKYLETKREVWEFMWLEGGMRDACKSHCEHSVYVQLCIGHYVH